MSRLSPLLAVAAALTATACVSLLPKEKPSPLFRFDTMPATPAPAPRTAPFAVRAGEVDFERAASTDRILALQGHEAAYIHGGRWINAAPTLFRQSLEDAFTAAAGPARMLIRGEPLRADYTLSLDVRAFEARYDHGLGAAPTVFVQVYAALVPTGTSQPPAPRLFQVEVPASENRISAIAAAFGQATGTVTRDIAAWVNRRGAG